MHGRSLERHATRFKELAMSWTTPEVKEICVGMEINDYMPAEF
ncbi:pyrroloquinoline quinone precursor peptide PqqA [Salinicola lusitanus]|uniref:Coenzyme PQQ synthesis protein A n=1 Tax=Salinicola lusitanus TaxID=1949085 RepID=A0ABZ3CUI8_9GAMM|nr:pyrroloquinoline quinone precursor peptide PqqA [Salinicola lusitanus]